MIKVEIELDEQKIIDDDKYYPDEIMKCLDDAFVRNGQQILEAEGFRRVYRDGGNTEQDFAVLGKIIMNFTKEDFFLPYAKKSCGTIATIMRMKMILMLRIGLKVSEKEV